MFINEQPRNGGMFRFDADYHQALARQRLVEGSGIKDTDILMLQHELYELSLMREYGYTYEIAHEMTNEMYNWQKAIIEEASK